jgi:hypothetical protein
MKSTMIRQSGSAIVASKNVIDAKEPSIRSLLLFVCGVAHVKSISYMAKGLPIRSLLLLVCGTVHVKSIS